MSGQRAWTLGLLCFGMVLSMLLARRWLMPSANELAAAIEVYSVSAEELYELDGFRRHEGSPESWSDISLSYQRDPAQGTYQSFCAVGCCRMKSMLRTAAFCRRFAAVRQTAGRLGGGSTAVPAWFQPLGTSQWRMDKTERGWIGQFLSFQPGADPQHPGWLHVWEWLDPQPAPAPLPAKPFGIDLLIQEVGQQLLGQQWPVRPDGWLEAPGQVPPPQWRSYAPNVDCWLLPAKGWFAMRLRHVSEDLSEAMLFEGIPLKKLNALRCHCR